MPFRNAWTGPGLSPRRLINTTVIGVRYLPTYRLDKMLVVVARRVHVFAHCIHFKHSVFVRNEEIRQLLPFAVLKIKPARFMLWRQDNWHTVVYLLHFPVGTRRHY